MGALSRTLYLLLTVLLAAPLAWAGTMYKWVDEDGTVHFTENPPPGKDAEAITINLEPDPVSDPYPSRDGDETPSAAQALREERAEARSEAQRERQRIETRCTQQQAVLDQLEPRPNVLIQNPDGSTTRMDDQERLRLISEAKQFLRENCD